MYEDKGKRKGKYAGIGKDTGLAEDKIKSKNTIKDEGKHRDNDKGTSKVDDRINEKVKVDIQIGMKKGKIVKEHFINYNFKVTVDEINQWLL